MYSASLLVVGTEIAEGIIQDTHTQYLAAMVKRLGFRLLFSTVTPDDEPLMIDALRRAAAASNLVIVTGGLGPTSDDRTREVVAAVAERKLVFHEEIWEALRERWRRWHGTNDEPAESNRRQALIPEGFEILANAIGSAPGFMGPIGDARVAALPGPPSELRHVVESQLLPRLEKQLEDTEELWGTAFLVGESSLEDAIQETSRRVGSTARWGTRAETQRIDFALRGGTVEEREAVLKGLQQRLGAFRIRRATIDPAARLLAALTVRGLTVATAESCTGGLIATLLTEIPGSSSAVWGGVVSYANEAKSAVLGVSEQTLAGHGAVSEETVREMLVGVRRLSGAHVAIAVSGIAGPGGGTDEKPVGTVWIGVESGSHGTWTRRFQFVGGRERVRRKSAVLALLATADVLEGELEGMDVDLDTYQIS